MRLIRYAVSYVVVFSVTFVIAFMIGTVFVVLAPGVKYVVTTAPWLLPVAIGAAVVLTLFEVLDDILSAREGPR